MSGSPQAPRLAEAARVEGAIGAAGQQGAGAAALGAEGDAGCGAPFDYLVRMRRFDQAGLFSRLIDEGGLKRWVKPTGDNAEHLRRIS